MDDDFACEGGDVLDTSESLDVLTIDTGEGH